MLQVHLVEWLKGGGKVELVEISFKLDKLMQELRHQRMTLIN